MIVLSTIFSASRQPRGNHALITKQTTVRHRRLPSVGTSRRADGRRRQRAAAARMACDSPNAGVTPPEEGMQRVHGPHEGCMQRKHMLCLLGEGGSAGPGRRFTCSAGLLQF